METENTKIELDFELTKDDLFALSENVIKNQEEFTKNRGVLPLIIPTMVLAFVAKDFLEESLSMYKVIFYFMVALIWMSFHNKNRLSKTLKSIKKQLEKHEDPNQICQQKIVLDNDGIAQLTKNYSSSLSWNGVLKIEESEKYYFIFNSSQSAYIIPKDKIKDQVNEVAEFLDGKRGI